MDEEEIIPTESESLLSADVLKRVPGELGTGIKEGAQGFIGGLLKGEAAIGLGASLIFKKAATITDKIVHDNVRKVADSAFEILGGNPDNIPQWRISSSEQLNSYISEASRLTSQGVIDSPQGATLAAGEDWIPDDFTKLEDWAGSSEKLKFALVETLGRQVPMIAATAGLGSGAGLASSVVINTAANFEDLKGRFDEETAINKAIGYGIVQASLDMLPIDRLVSAGITKGSASKVLWGAFQEGGTEALQQIISIVARVENKVDADKWREAFDKGAWQEVVESAGLGTIVGGGLNLGSSGLGIAVEKAQQWTRLEELTGIKGGPNVDLDLSPEDAQKVSGGSANNDIDVNVDENGDLTVDAPEGVTGDIEVEVDTNTGEATIIEPEVKPNAAQREAKSIVKDLKKIQKDLAIGRDTEATITEREAAGQKTTSRRIKVSKLSTDKDVQGISEALQAEIEAQGLIDPSVSQVQPTSDVAAGSLDHQLDIVKKFENDTGGSLGFLVQEMKSTRLSMKKLNSKLLTYRKILADNSAEITELVNKFKTNRASMTKQDILRWHSLRTFMATYEPSLVAIQNETGRALQSFGMPVDGNTVIDLRNDDLSQVTGVDPNAQVDQMVETLNLESELETFSKGWDGSAKAIKANKKKNDSASWGQVILGMRQANLLSNPFYRTADLAGSMIQRSLSFASDAVGSIIGAGQDGGLTLRGTAARVSAQYLFTMNALKSVHKNIPKLVDGTLSRGREGGLRAVQDNLQQLKDPTLGNSELAGSDTAANQEVLTGQNILSLLTLGTIDKKLTSRMQELAVAKANNKKPESRTIIDAMWLLADQVGAGMSVTGFGIMQVLDPHIRGMAFQGEMSGFITDAAVNRGASNNWSQEQVTSHIQDLHRTFEQMQDGTLKITPENKSHVDDLTQWIKDGRQTSAEAVFQQTTKGSEQAGLVQAADIVLTGFNKFPVVKAMLLPFAKTSINLTREFGRHIPLVASLAKTVQQDMSGVNGQHKQQKAYARQIVGAALFGLAYALYEEEKLTGAFTGRERRVKQAAGLQENSIRIGDTLINHERLAPLSQFFRSVADTMHTMDKVAMETDDKVTVVVWGMMAFGNSLLQNEYTKSLKDAFSILSSAEGEKLKETKRKVLSTASTFVPFGGLTSAFIKFEDDPHIREYLTFVDQIKTRTPAFLLKGADKVTFDKWGLGKPRNVALDILGEERLKNAPKNFVDSVTDTLGLRRSEISSDPVRTEMARLGINTQKIGTDISALGGKVELQPKDYRRLEEIVGEADLEGQLENFVTSDFYQSGASDPARKKFMTQIIRRVRRAAVFQLLSEVKGLEKELDTSAKKKSAEFNKITKAPDEVTLKQLLQ